MQPSEERLEVPVSKDAKSEGPIPSAWRPTLVKIVDAFVRHDYRLEEGVSGVTPVSADTAIQVREYLEDYGATLIALSEQSWDTSVCIWMGDHWNALIDLWTEEEGCSDLVLQVKVSEVAGEYVVTVYMVYVP